MSTIKDVAFAAGVSVGTVSRVLAGNGTVTTKMRLRVQTAIEELDFRPNFAARALRQQRRELIGVVVPDITNTFFSQLVKHIEILATQLGNSVILANTNDDPVYEKKQIHMLLERTPLGIILIAAPGDSARVFDTKTRLVTLDRKLSNYPCIATDHEACSRLAAAHILDLGHRRIAYIAGSAETEVAKVRQRGFLTEIESRPEYKSGELSCQLVDGTFDFISGETHARELLDVERHLRPTAIVAASDQQAIGVMRAAGDLGLKIPDDLSVVGFDDISLASLVKPRLTTIRQSVARLAEVAVSALTGEVMPEESIQLPGRLIIRNSTRSLNPDI